MIGSDDTDSATNTRIYLQGSGFTTSGQISYHSTSTGHHVFYTTNSGTERMRITSTGNVGIGTSSAVSRLTINPAPSDGDDSISGVPLTITHLTATGTTVLNDPKPILSLFRKGTSSQSYSAGAVFKLCRYENAATWSRTKLNIELHHDYSVGGETNIMSLRSDGNVVIGGNLNVGSLTNPSDSRIKKDIEDINDATALNKLLLIQPTTYNYIDVERNKGFGKVYGFIAQQIREVIPEAVPIIEYVIPNIYKSCLINNKREVYHSIPLDTPIDTDVKIRGSDYKIKEIYEDYFVIDKDIEDVEAFVYGYNINDFHTLDKTYIFTLNVCATQELHRRIETQSVLLKSQDDRIKDLETKVAMLMSNM